MNLKKMKARMRIKENQSMGQSFETMAGLYASTSRFGKGVKRTGSGSDFGVGKELWEVKSSSTAKLSRLQNKTRRNKPKNYKVVMPSW